MIPKPPAAVLVNELLAALDPMSYPQRMRRLALWARELCGSGELGAALDELARRGRYERGLAAMAARAGGESGRLRERLADPDSFVRGQALAVVRQGLIPDAAVAAAWEDAPVVVRRGLIRALVEGRRTALAEGLIRTVRERWGDREAARLLSACGPETVAELLPQLFHAVGNWSGLAARHSGAILDEAERRLAAEPEGLRRGWWQAYAESVAATIGYEPSRVLDLLERWCPGALPWQVHRRLGRLTAADPGRTARLLLAPGRQPAVLHGLPRPVLRTLERQQPAEFAELARRMSGDETALARLLREVPPSRRAACFDAAMAGRGTGHAVLADSLLEVLPRNRREAEARRMARQARERGAPRHTVLAAVAYLPVAEARPELLAEIRRPAATDRAYGYRLLFRNAANSGDPAVVTELLAGLKRLRNEQDPVRSPALAALARVHPALFTDEAAPHLERITVDAVEARDTSGECYRALNDLAAAVLREHAGSGARALTGWALRTLDRISGTGRLRLGALRRGQEHEVFEALRPSLEAGARKADFRSTLALADELGERARALPGLQDLLRRAIRHGGDSFGRQAAPLWLDDPRTRDERLAELLALDVSFATVPGVAGLLARHRTDLLDAVLGDTPPYGRLLTAGSHWLPPVLPAASRWLPRQQAAAARLLDRAAADAALPAHQRADAIRRAAWIPEYGTELLLRYADSAEVPLAEAALAALARTERPGEHLPVLLAHAGGDRARVAVYAAARAGRHVAPAQLAEALRRLLLADSGVKVTGRKEAVRLAATLLPVREAAGLLAEVCARPDQHHDVQAACVAFSTGLPACEEAWTVLESAAAGRRELRMAVLRTRPLDLPERHRPRYAGLIRALCDTDDPEVAAGGYAALGQWARWSTAGGGMLAAAVTDLENRSGWRAAANGLCAVVLSGTSDATPLTGALAALIAADARPGTPDAEPARDRPARQRIRHLAVDLSRKGRAGSRTARRVAREAAELLGSHADFVTEAAEILVQTVDLDAAAATLTAELTHLALLHEGRPALAVRTAGALDGRLRLRRVGDTAWGPAARSLAEDGGHATGLFAAVLTATGGRRTDWAAPWREQLRALRRHPCPDVRDAALALRTAEE